MWGAGCLVTVTFGSTKVTLGLRPRAVLAAASLAFRAASDNLTRDSYLFVSRSHREGKRYVLRLSHRREDDQLQALNPAHTPSTSRDLDRARSHVTHPAIMRRPLSRTPVSKIDFGAKAAARWGMAALSAGEAEGGTVGVWARLLLHFALDVWARGREAPWNPTETTRAELNTGNELPGMPRREGVSACDVDMTGPLGCRTRLRWRRRATPMSHRCCIQLPFMALDASSCVTSNSRLKVLP